MPKYQYMPTAESEVVLYIYVQVTRADMDAMFSNDRDARKKAYKTVKGEFIKALDGVPVEAVKQGYTPPEDN